VIRRFRPADDRRARSFTLIVHRGASRRKALGQRACSRLRRLTRCPCWIAAAARSLLFALEGHVIPPPTSACANHRRTEHRAGSAIGNVSAANARSRARCRNTLRAVGRSITSRARRRNRSHSSPRSRSDRSRTSRNAAGVAERDASVAGWAARRRHRVVTYLGDSKRRCIVVAGRTHPGSPCHRRQSDRVRPGCRLEIGP
jgi:hypothetical protein